MHSNQCAINPNCNTNCDLSEPILSQSLIVNPSGYKKCTSLTDSIRTLCAQNLHLTAYMLRDCALRFRFSCSANHLQCGFFPSSFSSILYCAVRFIVYIFFSSLQRLPLAFVVICWISNADAVDFSYRFILGLYDCIPFSFRRQKYTYIYFMCVFVCVANTLFLLFPCNLVSEWIVAYTRKNSSLTI